MQENKRYLLDAASSIIASHSQDRIQEGNLGKKKKNKKSKKKAKRLLKSKR